MYHGVIAVEQHHRSLDLHYVVDALFAIVTPALQLAANLHARRKLRLGNRGRPGFVAHAKGVKRAQFQDDLIAADPCPQRLFHFWKMLS